MAATETSALKILELGKFYPPHWGGIETLLESFCEGFASHGAEVDCVVANDSFRTLHEKIRGVRVHRFGVFGQVASTSLAPGYVWTARGYRRHIWHHHFPNPLADLAFLTCRPKGPLMVTYHSDIMRQAKAMKWYGRIVEELLRRASRIVVGSPPLLDHSKWLAPHRQKCGVIPFGIRLERFGSESVVPEAEQARSMAAGRPVALTVGRLVPYKGQRFLLEAARELDVVVWMVGCGPLEEELKKLAGALGLAGRVVFFGAVREAMLIRLLQLCDFFVLPSISPAEAFGLVQVEAMACGKAVISCQLPSGVPFVNQDGVTGILVAPGDAPQLANAMRRMIQDRNWREQLGAAGRERAHKEFAEERMLERYWECFQRLPKPAVR